MNQSTAVRSLIALTLLSTGTAASGSSADYLQKVKPVLRERCYACHGALKQESGLRLDTAELMLRGGDSGPAVAAGNLDETLIIERIEASETDGRMPPMGKPLTPDEITAIKAWVAAGARAPDSERPEEDPRNHWAFQPPVRPELPRGDRLTATSNPIDRFIEAKHQTDGLTVRPAADKEVLLRRLSLDLIGLPPTREELHTFLADESPSAWNTVVDRLLDDPRHGERWARHWMDVWRYSDWYGRRYVPDVWNSAPQVWRWRDWIVTSLNRNLGYDQMVARMLAADEISPEDLEAGYATGYLIRNWYALNPNDWMRANVEHTSKAFLGLTFNCAHCHDHKYDPITNDDYFRLRAFFEPIDIRQDRVPGESDPGPFQEYDYGKLRKIQHLGAVRIFDRNPDAPTWFYTGGDERNRVTERGSMKPGVPAFLSNAPVEVSPVELPVRAWYPGMQEAVQQTVVDEAKTALAAAESKLKEAGETTTNPSPEAQQKLAETESAYESAVKQARQSGQPGALSGLQSLVLDAQSGGRCMLNLGHVQQLKSLPEGSRFELTLKILADAHVNFQLAKDIKGGLTASFVGFEKERIVAYHPGGFTQFEAGRYDYEAGQRQFDVRIVLNIAADQCLLTVRSTTDDKVLVDAVPISLNGWNPIGDEKKAITFDARTGSAALVDDLRLIAPGAEAEDQEKTLLSFDFESPKYVDGQDVADSEGVIDSNWSAAPGKSYVSATAGNETLRALSDQVAAARKAVQNVTLPLRAAEARLLAARTKLDSVEARIAADEARFGDASTEDRESRARSASRSEREATLHQAQADVLVQELALFEAESKPTDDKDRSKQIDTASKALTTARAQLKSARDAEASGKDSTDYTPLSAEYPKTSTGRRKALAEWIANRRNPLTARVAINHIWMRHFHSPLVSTVYDFGRNGSPPSHPQLLDWLAVELMENNWSMKHIHRLIVTSDAYRRESGAGELTANVKTDPDNRLLWRMNSGRMEAEVLRDSILYLAGKLDLTQGGRPLENTKALTTFRRSLYYEFYPEEGGSSELSKLFDAPNPLDCYRRTKSIVPQQALALTNSDLVHEASVAIVAKRQTQTSDQSQASKDVVLNEVQFVTEMFEQILSRGPTDEELGICQDALAAQRELLTAAKSENTDGEARASLVRALLNHNDFVTIR